jgi:formate dehydrogenase iron-sulfur subunit
VGLLVGGNLLAPVQQTVTTSCHHCVDPACMRGCPVNAYQKDPVTGIVLHLDDQCIGCGYCTFMCPYDAPRYSARRGIVRKCDMCSQRLAIGEAPACVQACPTSAISITVVDMAQAVQDSEAGRFVPGAVTPVDTVPTTRYTTSRALPPNLLPADHHVDRVEDSHSALAITLVLMQAAAGTHIVTSGPSFATGARGELLGADGAEAAFVIGLIALASAFFHLGRPHLAFRAFLGLRTSWLSREIATFTGFVGVAGLHALSHHLVLLEPWRPSLAAAAAALGLLAVGSSVMVYAATKRPTWNAAATAYRFYGSALILGSALVLLIAALEPLPLPREPLGLLLSAALVKLLLECAALCHARDRERGPLRRSAMLMLTELRATTLLRFGTATVGVLVPAGLLVTAGPAGEIMLAPPGAALLLGCCAIAELLERHLFFAAAPRPRMPGGPA